MLNTNPDASVENRVFDDIAIGESACLFHKVVQRDIDLFAAATGDINPTHVDPAFAEDDVFHHVIAHGIWGGGLISAVLGNVLPGPGTVYISQDLHFVATMAIGDTIAATVTVRSKQHQDAVVTLDCLCTNQRNETVVTGTACVHAPTIKVRRPRIALPQVRIGRHDRMHALIGSAAAGSAIKTAVVHPVDGPSLLAAVEAARIGLIVPTLIGPAGQLRALASQLGADIADIRVIDKPDGPSGAAEAVALARAGEVDMLMKGDLHTDELLHAVVASTTGLRTSRRISHVFVLDVPEFPRLLMITDAAINIAPTLAEKVGIAQNAIDLAHVLGIAKPRVAILSAVETVTTGMPSTLDAAALCKMADRGQITGALLDGPLAFDNAIDVAAAAQKHIVSEVAGRADILLVPNIEAGNMLVKQLTFLSGAESAGIVLGASVPIVLTSRADSAASRLASCALAVLMVRHGQVADGQL